MKIVISAGGSGGHIYPAISLIKDLLKNNNEIYFFGREKGMEKELTKKLNIKYINVNMTGLKGILSIPKFIINFFRSYKSSKKHLKQIKPDIVIGFGGYACSTTLYAATKLKIKTIIHEQNSVMGKANKFLSKRVNKVLLGMESNENGILVGNPRSEEFYSKYEKKRHIGVNVLIFAGSQGSIKICEYFKDNIEEFENIKANIHFVTGKKYYDSMFSNIECKENIKIYKYIDNMEEFIKEIDIVVSRAGATTLSELSVIGMPLILIPSPYVTNNHQYENAKVLEEQNACKILRESNIMRLPELLKKVIKKERYELSYNIEKTSEKESIKKFKNEMNNLIRG